MDERAGDCPAACDEGDFLGGDLRASGVGRHGRILFATAVIIYNRERPSRSSAFSRGWPSFILGSSRNFGKKGTSADSRGLRSHRFSRIAAFVCFSLNSAIIPCFFFEEFREPQDRAALFQGTQTVTDDADGRRITAVPSVSLLFLRGQRHRRLSAP